MVIIGTFDLQKPKYSRWHLKGFPTGARGGVEVANTTIGSPAALWSFNLCWCSAFRIFVMKLFSLVFGVFEKVQKKQLEIPIIHQWGRCIKVAWEHPKKSMILFFLGGWGSFGKRFLATIFAKKDKPEICKVEDDWMKGILGILEEVYIPRKKYGELLFSDIITCQFTNPL